MGNICESIFDEVVKNAEQDTNSFGKDFGKEFNSFGKDFGKEANSFAKDFGKEANSFGKDFGKTTVSMLEYDAMGRLIGVRNPEETALEAQFIYGNAGNNMGTTAQEVIITDLILNNDNNRQNYNGYEHKQDYEERNRLMEKNKNKYNKKKSNSSSSSSSEDNYHKTYVHTSMKLPHQVPYYQSMEAAAPIIPGYEIHENPETQNMGVLIIGVLIVGTAVKAIKTFGKFIQNTDPNQNTETAKQH